MNPGNALSNTIYEKKYYLARDILKNSFKEKINSKKEKISKKVDSFNKKYSDSSLNHLISYYEQALSYIDSIDGNPFVFGTYKNLFNESKNIFKLESFILELGNNSELNDDEDVLYVASLLSEVIKEYNYVINSLEDKYKSDIRSLVDVTGRKNVGFHKELRNLINYASSLFYCNDTQFFNNRLKEIDSKTKEVRYMLKNKKVSIYDKANNLLLDINNTLPIRSIYSGTFIDFSKVHEIINIVNSMLASKSNEISIK